MHAIGIHTKVDQGRAVIHFVVLEHDGSGWVFSRKFSHLCDRQEELPLQLANLLAALEHQIEGLDIRSVVLRDVDYGPRRRRGTDKVDHTADGVILAVLRAKCQIVQMLEGKDIGTACGSNKTTAEEGAAALHGTEFAEAGAAAEAATTLV